MEENTQNITQGQVTTGQDNDLATLLEKGRTINIGGKDVVINKMKVKHLPQIIAIAAPIMELIRSRQQEIEAKKHNVKQGTTFKKFELADVNLTKIVLYHNVQALQLVKVLCDEPPEFIDELDIEELIRLVSAIIEVNLDFFTRRALPSLSVEMGRLLSALKTMSP